MAPSRRFTECVRSNLPSLPPSFRLRLFPEVRVEGRTRVLSFGDVRLSDAHEQDRADSVTRVTKMI